MAPSRHDRLPLALAGAIGLAAACSPSQPTPPPVTIPPPAIACPAPPGAATSTNGHDATVTFAAPTVTGGTPPVAIVCTPSSGSAFPIGSTVVTCSAVDAANRSASCSLTVTVVPPPPRLTVARILAFGDSITEVEVPAAGEFDLFGLQPKYVELAQSYPADLTTMLGNRYTAQGAVRVDALTLRSDNSTDCSTDPAAPTMSGIVVINAGCLGDRAQDPSTLARLNDKLSAYQPDVVLLLEGVNDLADTASVPVAVQGVVTLVAAARARGVPVLVGTLLPEIANTIHGDSAPLIAPFNAQLVPAVSAAGARTVDLYADISGDIPDWISYDGLHPTEAGYAEIARVWFGTIQSLFESTATITAARPALKSTPCAPGRGVPCRGPRP